MGGGGGVAVGSLHHGNAGMKSNVIAPRAKFTAVTLMTLKWPQHRAHVAKGASKKDTAEARGHRGCS